MNMQRRFVLAIGVLLAVGGFGLTRWAGLAVSSQVPSDHRTEMDMWLNGNEKWWGGVPLHVYYAIGWSVTALGCAVCSISFGSKPQG